MRASRRGRAAVLLLGLATLLGAVSCDGDDDDGGILLCLQFAAAASPSPNTVVAVDGPGSTCSIAELDLVITDVSDILGISFTATFDPAVVAFSSVSTSGSVLESDADLAVEVGEGPGSVTIGVTRVAATPPGVGAMGSAKLVTLRFASTGSLGSTMVTFSPAKVLGSETPPQEKPDIVWSGGTLERL